MNKNIIIILAIIIVSGAGFFFLPENRMKENSPAVDVFEMQNEVQNDVQIPDQIETETINQEPVTTGAGSYELYSPEKIAMAASEDVVLYFYASWCPSCQMLDRDIEEKASSIPAGITILKTDYDEETELKSKYGVTSQHTLVQVDENGNLINKWAGGSNLEDLLSQIQ